MTKKMTVRRRAAPPAPHARLVLVSEGARHPFRQLLPQALTTLPRAPRLTREDGQMFVLSFVAFFTAFYGFIA